MFDASNANRAWCAFANTLLTVARADMPPESAARLSAWSGPPGVGGVEALREFFLTPSHRVAIQTLNYSLFLTPIPFAGQPFPLQDTMAMFSTMGGERFGRVWLGLIDVAEASGVPDVAAARNYAHEQTTSAGGAGAAAVAPFGGAGDGPHMAQLDGLFQFIGSTIPGLEGTMELIKPMVGQIMGSCNNILGGGGADGSEVESDTIAQLQNNVIRPLLENLGRTTAGDVDLSGPIQMIMSGFKGLTEALTAAHSAPATGPPADGAAMMKLE